MAAATNKETHLEIAHILFVDTVGYSQLSTSEQHDLLETLNLTVRATARFRAAEAADQLIRLPTGDGMALVFCDDPESPIQCALEIFAGLRDHPELRLRMGIHSGPVSRVVDVNDHCNVAGAGVNMAERVMTCGNAGHLLLSKRAANDLAEFSAWRPHLYPLGQCQGKHGAVLEIVNFFNGEFGNPEPPEIFQRETQPPGKFVARAFKSRWALLAGGIALLAVLGVSLYFILGSPRPRRPSNLPPPSPTGAPYEFPEKSIAVLPFENLSDEKENEYFADGVQDEIRNDLAKVADLKVISRTSVLQYKTGVKRELRDIARSLGVAHVLEGSVQRVGEKIRVSARLVDARADRNLWAQHYDRNLTDVFAIQSEIAKEIVGQLQARLSPGEKAAIEEVPTTNLAAYNLYVKAKALGAALTFSSRSRELHFEAVSLLEQAVELDHDFFRAYCQLARTHDQIYLLGLDRTPERLAQAYSAVQTVLRLRPDSGAAHLAAAYHFYAGLLDYDRARIELAIAHKALPNEPLIFEIEGYVARRQGRFTESIAAMRRALELDPRNLVLLQQISFSLGDLRRYPEMAELLDRALAIDPQDAAVRVARALIELQAHADPKPARETINTILSEDPAAASDLARGWFYLALCERDSDSIRRSLAALPPRRMSRTGIPVPRRVVPGPRGQGERRCRAKSTRLANRPCPSGEDGCEVSRLPGSPLCSRSHRRCLGPQRAGHQRGETCGFPVAREQRCDQRRTAPRIPGRDLRLERRERSGRGAIENRGTFARADILWRTPSSSLLGSIARPS